MLIYGWYNHLFTVIWGMVYYCFTNIIVSWELTIFRIYVTLGDCRWLLGNMMIHWNCGQYKQTTSQHGRSLAVTSSHHPTWRIVNFRGAERNDPGPSRKIWMTCLFPSFVRNAKAAVPELLSNELEGKGAEKQDEISKQITEQKSSTANVCYWLRL